MFTVTFATITFVIFAAAVAALSVTMQRAPVAEKILTSPFGLVGSAYPSEDTLEGGMTCRVFQPSKTGEWQLKTCDTLREVENTLDSLENHGILEREVVVMSNSCFALRWKC